MKKNLLSMLFILMTIILSSCSLNKNTDILNEVDYENTDYIEVDYMSTDDKMIFDLPEDKKVQVLKRTEVGQVLYYKIIENEDYIQSKENHEKIIEILDSGIDLSADGFYNLKSFWFPEEIPVEEIMPL